ncbi:MAG TPA: hypothetical protein VHP38_06385 [Ruminiclostridium sp.]|nr:hypothetical protein [Ruminiclostridium sp.]
MYKLNNNPKGQDYKNLLDIAFDICDEFILIRRQDMDFHESAIRVIKLLEPYLIEIKKSSSWPGTLLLEQTADVFSYKTDNGAKNILLDAAQSLYSWVQPGLPEDLCFYKNQIPWMSNTAHEKQCIFENLSNDDLLRIKEISGLQIVTP